jgi:hypothetical protein
LLIDVNLFVTGGGNMGIKSKAESERATDEPSVALSFRETPSAREKIPHHVRGLSII